MEVVALVREHDGELAELVEPLLGTDRQAVVVKLAGLLAKLGTGGSDAAHKLAEHMVARLSESPRRG